MWYEYGRQSKEMVVCWYELWKYGCVYNLFWDLKVNNEIWLIRHGTPLYLGWQLYILSNTNTQAKTSHYKSTTTLMRMSEWGHWVGSTSLEIHWGYLHEVSFKPKENWKHFEERVINHSAIRIVGSLSAIIVRDIVAFVVYIRANNINKMKNSLWVYWRKKIFYLLTKMT